MAIKLARAMGARVVLFTTSASKGADALRLGAHEVVLSSDPAQMQARTCSFDFILDTVSAAHDLGTYLVLLKRDGDLTLVGAPEKPLTVAPFSLIFPRRSISGSLIGGLPETQEMLDFCGRHGIASDIEKIRMDQINDAYERMLRGDVRFEFLGAELAEVFWQVVGFDLFELHFAIFDRVNELAASLDGLVGLRIVREAAGVGSGRGGFGGGLLGGDGLAESFVSERDQRGADLDVEFEQLLVLRCGDVLHVSILRDDGIRAVRAAGDGLPHLGGAGDVAALDGVDQNVLLTGLFASRGLPGRG